MAVRMSALSVGHASPPERFLVLISVRGWVNSRVIVWLEELGTFGTMTSVEIEPTKQSA
jgi:hypothetical protein